MLRWDEERQDAPHQRLHGEEGLTSRDYCGPSLLLSRTDTRAWWSSTRNRARRPAKFDCLVHECLIKLGRSGTRDSGSAKPARQASGQSFRRLVWRRRASDAPYRHGPHACSFLGPLVLLVLVPQITTTSVFFSLRSLRSQPFRNNVSSSKILTGPSIRAESWHGIDALHCCLSRHLQPARLSCWRRQDTTYLTPHFDWLMCAYGTASPCYS